MKDGRGRDKVVAFFASRPPTGLDRWHQFIACRRRLTKEYFNVHLTNLTEKEGHLKNRNGLTRKNVKKKMSKNNEDKT